MLEAIISHKKILLLITSSLQLFIVTSIIYSKPSTKNYETQNFDLKKESILLNNYRGKIWVWDETSKQFRIIVDLNLEHQQLLSISVDTASQTIYILEGSGSMGGITLGNSQILMLDIERNEQTVIFKKRNIFHVSLSADMKYALVASFPVKATRPNLLEVEWCVLDIARKICADLNLVGYTLKWLNTETIFATDRVNSYLIDVKEFNKTKLPLSLIDAVSIPSSEKVLISRADNSFGFLELNLKTLNAEIYDIKGKFDPISSIFQNMIFSDDGKYLLFKNNHDFLIVDFSSSEIIEQLSDWSSVTWLSNNTLIGLKFPIIGQYPVEIIRYNLSNKTSEKLASYNEPVTLSTIN